jgi:hypothetical protein
MFALGKDQCLQDLSSVLGFHLQRVVWLNDSRRFGPCIKEDATGAYQPAWATAEKRPALDGVRQISGRNYQIERTVFP